MAQLVKLQIPQRMAEVLTETRTSLLDEKVKDRNTTMLI